MEDNSNTPNQAFKHDLTALDSINNRVNKFRVKSFEKASYLSDLSNYIDNTDTLVEFIQKLLSYKSLKSFETIHLFIHQKGLTKTDHLEILRSNYRNYTHDISDFSSFFQSIKKSKNR